MAADVTGNSVADTLDVLGVQRFFLGFTTGTFNTGKYQFSPPSRSYSGVITDQTAQNYDAFVYGDVQTPFIPRPDGSSETTANDGMSVSALSGLDTSAEEVLAMVATLSLPNIAVAPFVTDFITQVTVTSIDARERLIGFQGDLTFDEKVVRFQDESVQKAGLTKGNWNVSGHVLDGPGPIRTLRVSAYSMDTITPLSGSGTLFELRMIRVGQAAQSTPLVWALAPNQFMFIDGDLKMQKPRSVTSGSVTQAGKR
jgi:hypothetical protein